MRAGAWWLVAACGGDGPELTGFEQAPPRGAVEVAAPAPGPSTVAVPITLALSGLREAVSAKVPEVLLDVKDEALERGLVGDVRVVRTGAPEVDTADGSLAIALPLHLSVKPRPAFAKGAKVSVGTVEGDLTVTVRLRPTLSPDWRLEPHAEVTHRWRDRPTLTVGPVRLDVAAKTDPKLRARLADVAADLDVALADDLDVRGKVQAAWGQLGVVHPLRDEPPAWLRFEPSALFASQPRLDAAGVHLTVGATGTLAVVVAPTAPVVTPGPLPPRIAPPARSGARVAAQLEVDWAVLRDQLAKGAEGQVIQQALPTGGQATVTLRRVLDVFPTGDTVAVGVEVGGEVAGSAMTVFLWLTGRPALAGDALRIEDFTYVAQSDTRWVTLAQGALGERVRDALAERLVVPLGERRNQLIGEVNARLAEPPPGAPPGVRMVGKVTGADLTGVSVTDAALVVGTALTGELAVTVLR